MALGIDPGGTKIKAQIFGASWTAVDSLRLSSQVYLVQIHDLPICRRTSWAGPPDGALPI
ncbi:MAG: hypothetical protein IIX61_09890 [Loktanella sp.]|nr:hypothetical protein [Loktanella sp.]